MDNNGSIGHMPSQVDSYDSKDHLESGLTVRDSFQPGDWRLKAQSVLYNDHNSSSSSTVIMVDTSRDFLKNQHI